MPDQPIVSPVSPSSFSPNPSPVIFSRRTLILAGIIIVAAGLATGFFLSRSSSGTGSNATVGGKDQVKTANEIGSRDTKTFSDKAAGVVEKGGLNGEGTHKLIRTGGASQTVYLVSSIIDLDEYAGKNVEVYGQTLKAQKVGWLMDVGRLIILE